MDNTNKATEYRALAARFRLEAEQTLLLQQRQMATRSAERWEELAEDLERVMAPTIALGGQRPNWII